MSRNVLIALVAFVVVIAAAGAGVVLWTKQGTPKAAGPAGGPKAGGPTIPMPGGPAAQAGGQKAGGGGMSGPARREPARALVQLGATQDQLKILLPYTEERRKLTTELRAELEKVTELARDQKSTDAQVAAALKAFRKKRDETKRKLKDAETQLGAKLDLDADPKLAAGLTSAGLLDNGLGTGGGRAGGQRGSRGGGGAGGGPQGMMGGGMGGPGGGMGGGMGGPGGGGRGGGAQGQAKGPEGQPIGVRKG